MIQKLPFGRTGHASTRVIFGAWALSESTQKEADQVLELLLEYGINHIDTARMYGNAEQWVGTWMEKHRDRFFLATKTGNRTHRGAISDLHQSLKLLKVDYVDLWQMHGLTGQAGWETAMGDEGALETFVMARDKGLVRFLGVTGHGVKAPSMHKQSLERFDFDSVLVPYNYTLMQYPRYATDYNLLASLCRQRHVALQTIKSVARKPWKDQPKTYHTYFYEPLASQESVDLAVHWVLGSPDTFLITAGDIQILPMILDAASRFVEKPSEVDMKAIVKKYDFCPIFHY